MTSWQMRAVSVLLRRTRKPLWVSAERMRAHLGRPKKSWRPPASLAARHDVGSRSVRDTPCCTVRPRGHRNGSVVIYLHGGGYVNEIVKQHWALVSRLADAGARVEVPLYGLAPRHTYREAYPFLTDVYRQVLTDVEADRVTFVGDSAGGGLALGFAQTLAAAGLPQPRRLVLLSPWLDVTVSNPAVIALEDKDPWLGRSGALEAGRAWAGGDDPADPRLSPINGPVKGLAPITAYVGTHEMIYPDVLALRDRCAAEGVPFDLTVCEGAVHVYPLIPVPEGRRAATDIARRATARS
ncbi:alpha/beta hydrolase fold domain-containing protein [Streptomyces sp. URMC 129]|uniref:alpha/beta hydrolase fold domain-containing protein n=1 Tax=Streptomyces sp. URMC 129 TaxID=3423407 RepID=UPI003F1B6AB0